MDTARARDDGRGGLRGLGRIASLSDGIFAVALTLLVLDIRVPPADGVRSEVELMRALWATVPRFVLYLVSFLTLGLFWTAQRAQLGQLARLGQDLAWLHLGFLSLVVLLPFSTSLLGECMGYRTALAVYWLNVVALGLVLLAGWWCAEWCGLLRADAAPGVARAARIGLVRAQAAYAVGAALCVVDTRVSILVLLAVKLWIVVSPMRFLRRRVSGDKQG